MLNTYTENNLLLVPDPRPSEVINSLPPASKGTRFALQNNQESCNYLQAT